jgi:hypothetical protein
MKIYIDEGGHFTPNAGISVLCSLSLPHATSTSAGSQLERVSQRWPRVNGELKGGALNKAQLTAATTVLFSHDAILHCIATDVALENETAISEHKANQCDGITRHLGPDHHPELVAKVRSLRSTLERMPDQLYVQCVLLSDLVMTTAAHDAMYFSQRRPDELARFDWIIDAKDPKRITTQEAWWRDTLGPLGESKSRVHPFLRVDDANFDYSIFDASFGMTKDLFHPSGVEEDVGGVNISKLITKSVRFRDSRSDILLQAADILASFMRRVLNSEIRDPDVIRQLGRLQILQTTEGIMQPFDFVRFSPALIARKGLGKVARVMNGAARTMILKGFAAPT